MTLMTQVANPAWLFDLKFFNSPSLRFQEETFWRSLCLDCRKQSVFEHICRPLKNQTAWDVAGPVQWKWHDELLHVVDEYMSRNRREILKGKAWLGSIDCWMVGEHLATTTPTIVVTSLYSGATKRLVRLLQNDHHIKSSGFELMKRKSCLKRTGGGTDIKQMQESKASPEVSYKRATTSSYLGRRFTAGSFFGQVNDLELKRCATYGGFVIVNGTAYVLTVAHVFLQTHFDDHPTQAGTLEGPETVSPSLEQENETGDSDSTNNSSETDTSDPVAVEDAPLRSEMLIHATCCEDEADADASFRLRTSGGLGMCADLKADWALVTPVNLPESQVNRIVAGDQILTISTLGDFSQGMKLLVINSNDREPVQSTCSGTRSLISLPGSNGMQVAYIISHPSISGESGSWVIDGTTGDFCGVIVAASPDGNSSYVVSSRDIFASIANLYCTGDGIPQISLPYSVESQQTPTPGGTISESDQVQITTLSHARPSQHRYVPHGAFSALTGPRRTSQRPRTVAHFPSLQEERQEDMQGSPAYQASQNPPEADYHGDTDDVIPSENSITQHVMPPRNSIMQPFMLQPFMPVRNSIMQYQPPRSPPTSENNTDTGPDDDVDRLKMTDSLQASSQPQQQVQQRLPRVSDTSPSAPDVHAGKKRTSSAAGLLSSTKHVQRRAFFNYWRCHACQHYNLISISPACDSENCSHEKCPLCTLVRRKSLNQM